MSPVKLAPKIQENGETSLQGQQIGEVAKKANQIFQVAKKGQHIFPSIYGSPKYLSMVDPIN